MQWWAVGVTTLLVGAWFWLPGCAVLAAAGVRGLRLAALAPLITIGILAPAATVVSQFDLGWGVVPAALTVGVAVVAFSRRRGSSEVSARPARRAGMGLGIAVVVAAAAQLVPIAIGMGRPGRLLTAEDALTHLSGMAYVGRTGNASAFTFRWLEPLGDQPFGFYPTGWHAVAGLVPTWPDASTAFNVAVVVPIALAWTLGVAALTQALLPARPRAAVWAALLSATGIGTPLLLTLRPEGMIPNAYALALVPALLVLHTQVRSGRAAALVAIGWVGLAMVHPNAALTAALLLIPLAAARARPAVARMWAGRRARTVASIAGGLAVLIAAYALAGPLPMTVWRAVLAAREDDSTSLLDATLALVSGNATGMGGAAGALVVVAGLAGGVLARRLKAGWWVWSAVLLAAFYLAAASDVPILSELDRPWYGEPRRFAPALALTLVPLAALALDTIPRRLVRSGRLRTSLPPQRVAAVIAGAVVVASTIGGAAGLWSLAQFTWVGTADEPVVADDDELAMMHRLGGELGAGRVVGSPYSGVAHLYAVAGVDAVPRSTFVHADDDLTRALARLDVLDEDPTVCATLRGYDIRYIYADTAPWTGGGEALSVTSVSERVARLVDSGGTARVYELTGCD